MIACRIPHPERVAVGGGIRARYYRGAADEPFLDRVEPAISYAFLPQACQFPYVIGQPPCRVEWEGVLQVPADGTYRFSAQARHGTLRVWIDGQPLRGAMQLTAGPHQLRAEARFAGVNDESQEGGARLFWRRGPDAAWELVPFQDL
jgi:hypothetical protein